MLLALTFNIPLPTGNTYTVYASDGQDRSELVQRLILDYWADYIDNNWLQGDGERDSGEQRVKRLLDSCGYFILRGDAENVLSEYKTEANKVREIPVSSCQEILSDAFFSTAKHGQYYDESGGFDVISALQDINGEGVVLGEPKKKFVKPQESLRFNKLFMLREKYPLHKLTWCRVDTNNEFLYGGKTYRVSSELATYLGVNTKQGIYYCSDQILISDDGITLGFYDQNVVKINGEDVKPVSK